MITYDPLWKTMKEKNISQYRLVKAYGFSAGQLNRLKNNQYVSTHTIGVLCTILECSVEDIMEFRMDKSEGLYPIMETVSIQPEEDEPEGFVPEESVPADHQWLFILVLLGFPDSEDIADAVYHYLQASVFYPADHLISALLLHIKSRI